MTMSMKNDDAHTPAPDPTTALREALVAALPDEERIASMIQSADLSMRDQWGRHRSRTSYYWRDMGHAVAVLLMTHVGNRMEVALRSPAPLDVERRTIEACIYYVQQSLDTVRGEDDGESRTIRASIAAREHVIALLTGYRDRVAREYAALTPYPNPASE